MGKIIQSRKVIRDVTYRWIPFLFVVLTVIVCTALLSTSGKPPRGIVVTFSVMAGLLVFFFLSCHLMLYCTGVKHEMDTEGANCDNGNADPSPQLDSNIPPGFLPDANVNTNPNANTNTQVQQRGRDQTEHHHLGRYEQHRHSQHHPDHHTGHHASTRSPAAQHDVRGLNQVAGYGSDEPPPQSRAENRVHHYNLPRTLEQRLSERSLRRSSAAPDPLHPKRPPHQAESTQQRSQPGLGLEGFPSRSRRPSSGDDKVLHSARTTRSYMEVAEPRPHESTQWHPATTRAGAPYQVTQRGAPEYQLHGRSNAVRRKKSELFLDETRDRIRGASAHVDTPGHQAEPRGYPAEAPNSVQAHFALLGVPDVWGLASRLLSDMKPRARLRRKSADDCCDRPPSDDAADLVLLREINRKHVQVHPAAAEVERVRSQKVLVQRVPVRDSNDSGYYSADSSQHPPAWPQPAGPSIAVSSAASTGPPLSSGPSARSSLGAGAENSPNPNSASSMRSEQMARFERESMEAEGAIRVAMEQPLHDGRLKPRRRSRSC